MRWAWAMIAAALVGCAERAPEAPDTKPPAASQTRPPPPPAVGEGAIRAGAERPQTARSFAAFRPSVHGFAFINDFTGDALGGMGAKLGLPSRFGLCGGMSFAAADYYLAGKPVPEMTSPPAAGTALYNYLYARQAASNGFLGSMGVKFLEWMQLPDVEVRTRTRAELPGIVASLGRGEPVVIGEVLQTSADKGGKAWENHQVLAYGTSQANGQTRIAIYDPNFPRRDDVAIVVKEDGTVWRVGGGRGDRNMRGFFRMGYERAEPK